MLSHGPCAFYFLSNSGASLCGPARGGMNPPLELWVTHYLFNGYHLLICQLHHTWRIKQPTFYNTFIGTSLVAQWLRIGLPMQGTWVRPLVREDPTCHGATKPVRHNYWACALEPASHNYWAHEPQLLSPRATTTEPTGLEPMLCNKEKPPQWETRTPQQRPNAAKNK